MGVKRVKDLPKLGIAIFDLREEASQRQTIAREHRLNPVKRLPRCSFKHAVLLVCGRQNAKPQELPFFCRSLSLREPSDE
jgi:hypothetical protein